jgi:hypothetical protein
MFYSLDSFIHCLPPFFHQGMGSNPTSCTVFNIFEREMCLWAISKYFGDWVQTQVLKCENMPKDDQSTNHKLRYVSKP